MYKELSQKIYKIQSRISEAASDYHQLWQTEILFSWRWWLSFVLAFLPWLVWIKYRRRESTDRLLYSGFFVLLVSAWLDFNGLQLGLWYYPIDVVPTIPSSLPYDTSILPVMVMLLIQI